MYLLLLSRVNLPFLSASTFRLRGLNSGHKGDKFPVQKGDNTLVATIGNDAMCNITIGQGARIVDEPTNTSANSSSLPSIITDDPNMKVVAKVKSPLPPPNPTGRRILRMLALANKELNIVTDNVGTLHGAIFHDENGFSYSDFNARESLGPEYTSKLNGVELEPGVKYPLQPGDILEIGDYQFVFEKSGILRNATRTIWRSAASLLW